MNMINFNRIYNIFFIIISIFFVCGCGNSKYSGKWYCGRDLTVDIDMSKKKISFYLPNSKSSMPNSISDIEILTETDRGIMFSIKNNGSQIRIEDGKLYVSGIFNSLICTRNQKKI